MKEKKKKYLAPKTMAAEVENTVILAGSRTGSNERLVDGGDIFGSTNAKGSKFYDDDSEEE